MTKVTTPKTQAMIPLLLLALFVAGMYFIQFASPNMPDNDGFYHIKLAAVMREQGLTPQFTWLPLSILSAEEFYDHHFLFHVALIPFTLGDLRLGAKWSAVIFASLAFLAVWYLFHRQKVPLAWLWAVALLGISDAFLYRMSITRAQSLSLAVLALTFAWLLEGKYKHLGALAFLYVWLYDAFPLMIALAGLHLLAVLLVERRLEIRPLLYVGAGIALGLVINPYFPQNIIFSYNHMLPKLTEATSVSVGNEWFPYETKTLLKNSFPSLVAFAGGALALGLSGRKMDVRTALGFLSALLFGLMLFQARRFVEYFPPFALIFASFAWTPLLSPQADGEAGSPSRAGSAPSRFAAAVLAVAVAFSIAVSLPRARDAVSGAKPYNLYAGASEWLRNNSVEGERVFQTDWDDFPRLFFYNTHNAYLIGLDPTYMQLYDADLYDLWVDITRGDVETPARVIAETFGSQYVHTDLKHEDFLRVAENDPGLVEVYRDDQAVIFKVITQP